MSEPESRRSPFMGEDAEILRERLAAIVQSSDDAIYSKDAEAVLDSWNPAAQRLYGYTAEEAIGRHVSFIVPPTRKGEEADILRRVLTGERIDHFETQRVAKSGEILDVSITVSPIRDEDGRIFGASVIARDIRDPRRLNELQRGLDRTEFIARAAHELRNPISALVGMAHMLIDDRRLSTDQRKRAAESIQRQGMRVSALLSDLLDLSYVESGRYEMKLGPVPVGEVVNDAIESADLSQGKDLRVDIPDDSVVLGDSARLAQVFVNLISNACKYGGDQVIVTARSHGGRVVIEVSDNGAGVPAHIRDKLFDPFVRGHAGIAGTGLGLAITARLIEAQGGDIRLDPVKPSSFVVELPSAAGER